MTFLFSFMHQIYDGLLCFYVLISAFCITTYFLNKYPYLIINPPKSHPFVKKELKSATSQLAVALAAVSLSPLMFNIILNSAYLYSAGLYLYIFSDAIGQIPIEVLIRIMNFIIQNTIDMSTQAQEFLYNSSTSLERLREIHAYLTPYIGSYESILHLIERIVQYLQYIESDHSPRIVGLLIEFRHALVRLIEVYRGIEGELSITMYDTPIPLRN
jgi:hypothetical protein